MIIRCIDRCQIQCDPQLRLQIGVCTQARECQPMCEQEVMSCNVSRLLFTATWSMFAGPVSKIGRAPGLIQGDPPVDAVSQQSRDYYVAASISFTDPRTDQICEPITDDQRGLARLITDNYE